MPPLRAWILARALKHLNAENTEIAEFSEPFDGRPAAAGRLIDRRGSADELLENAYDECFAVELGARGLTIERQKPLPVIYKDQRVNCGYRLDFIVERIVMEVKAVERLERVHSVQLLSYLRFARCPLGLLFNFHAGYLTRDGLKRVVNGFPG